ARVRVGRRGGRGRARVRRHVRLGLFTAAGGEDQEGGGGEYANAFHVRFLIGWWRPSTSRSVRARDGPSALPGAPRKVLAEGEIEQSGVSGVRPRLVATSIS